MILQLSIGHRSRLSTGGQFDPIALDFIGLHGTENLDTDSPRTPIAGFHVKSLRIFNQLGLRWRWLETSPNTYDFSPLISFLEDAGAAGIEHFTYVLASLPADLAVGDAGINARVLSFVPALATALKSAGFTNVDLQIWNEPDGGFWTGNSQATFHAAFAGVAEAWHTAMGRKAIGPCMTREGSPWLEALLPYGTLPLEHVRAYSVNAYPNPAEPEAFAQYIQPFVAMARRDGVEVWNTEQTWDNFRETPGSSVTFGPTLMGTAQGVSYIWRATLAAIRARVDRFYWFGPDEHFAAGADGYGCIPMVDETTRAITDEGNAFAFMVNALVGARFTDWAETSGLMSVRVRKGSTDGRILWRSDGQSGAVDLTAYSSGTDMYGDPITLTSSYGVTSEPIYVFE